MSTYNSFQISRGVENRGFKICRNNELFVTSFTARLQKKFIKFWSKKVPIDPTPYYEQNIAYGVSFETENYQKCNRLGVGSVGEITVILPSKGSLGLLSIPTIPNITSFQKTPLSLSQFFASDLNSETYPITCLIIFWFLQYNVYNRQIFKMINCCTHAANFVKIISRAPFSEDYWARLHYKKWLDLDSAPSIILKLICISIFF